MGLGISIDVFLATMSQFRHLEPLQKGQQWITRITGTHTLFPMIGYYFVAGILLWSPVFSIALGLVAATLIARLLWIAYSSWFEEEELNLAGSTVPWSLVLAVSWDALLSGPAKAAQALEWSEIQIIMSFPIAGLVVTIIAAISLWLARQARGRWLDDDVPFEKMASRHTVAFCFEFIVLGYFGVLAFVRLSLDLEIHPIALFGGWTGICIAFFMIQFGKLKASRLGGLISEVR